MLRKLWEFIACLFGHCASEADSLVLDVMRKGAEVLALFDSITKPQEKAVEARMV